MTDNKLIAAHLAAAIVNARGSNFAKRFDAPILTAKVFEECLAALAKKSAKTPPPQVIGTFRTQR